mmetsp:Transcript_13424/g.30105  ORF Transcript_13424/g.30105 Transcript_13424/m.30105 type:complete len:540 (-) Transcript_13424:260-1879(-)
MSELESIGDDVVEDIAMGSFDDDGGLVAEPARGDGEETQVESLGGGDVIQFGSLGGDDEIKLGSLEGNDVIQFGSLGGNDVVQFGNLEGNDVIHFGTLGANAEITLGSLGGNEEIKLGTVGGNDEIKLGTLGGNDEIKLGGLGGNEEIKLGGLGGNQEIKLGGLGGNEEIKLEPLAASQEAPLESAAQPEIQLTPLNAPDPVPTIQQNPGAAVDPGAAAAAQAEAGSVGTPAAAPPPRAPGGGAAIAGDSDAGGGLATTKATAAVKPDRSAPTPSAEPRVGNRPRHASDSGRPGGAASTSASPVVTARGPGARPRVGSNLSQGRSKSGSTRRPADLTLGSSPRRDRGPDPDDFYRGVAVVTFYYDNGRQSDGMVKGVIASVWQDHVDVHMYGHVDRTIRVPRSWVRLMSAISPVEMGQQRLARVEQPDKSHRTVKWFEGLVPLTSGIVHQAATRTDELAQEAMLAVTPRGPAVTPRGSASRKAGNAILLDQRGHFSPARVRQAAEAYGRNLARVGDSIVRGPKSQPDGLTQTLAPRPAA